tara:strand:- start:1473 stop:2198 length:726 start_codon:yes stop_codon:yes gene_type:complete
MNVLIIHPGTLAESFAASAVNKGIRKKYPDCNISWVVDHEALPLFLSNKMLHKVFSYGEFWRDYKYEPYDWVINLGDLSNQVLSIQADEKCGFQFDKSAEKYYNCLYRDVPLNMNLFQIYFRLAKISWRGEGYDFNYYPRFKSKKNRVGIAIANANLRNFVNDRLDLKASKLWIIPYKKNILRRMDEINRCKRVITDDLFTSQIAIALKKFVYFLQIVPLAFNIEMFGSGKVYPVPTMYLR